LGRPCLEAYQKLVPPSQPETDFEQRNAVYAMKYHVLLSILHSGERAFRDILVDELKGLVDALDRC
jgi:hypothetical protein